MNESTVLQNCENNVKLYQKYKMFAYDFLFYYAISVAYFSITKGFSMSEVMYISAFYTFFVFFWQIPANFIAEKLGIRNSIILGNILTLITVTTYLLAPVFSYVIIGEFFGALGFTLKSLSEGTLLFVSLKKLDKKSGFSKVEGKSNAKYYYYDAFASFIAGFLFIFNNYLPMILCAVNVCISLFISFRFKSVESKEKSNTMRLREVAKQFKNIINSKRSRSIFIYAFIFMGVISVSSTLYRAILGEMNMNAEYVAMVVCMYTILVGMGAKSCFYLEKKTRNKTLSIFAMLFIVALLFMGLIAANFPLTWQSLSAMMIALAIMGFIQGAYRVAIKKYVLNFTNTGVRTKITSTYYMFENLGSSCMLFLSGFMLNFTNTAITCVILASCFFVIMIVVLRYMKSRIGLKPEEYNENDIYHTTL